MKFRLEVFKEDRTAAVDHLIHPVEAALSPVVGVGYIVTRLGVMGSQEADLVDMLPGRQIEQFIQVLSIHGEDVVEFREVPGTNLSRRLTLQADPIVSRNFRRAGVWRVANMPTASTSGFDFDMIPKTACFDQMAEDALTEGRAADVAHADKEKAFFHQTPIKADGWSITS